jgi:hypothetical protein
MAIETQADGTVVTSATGSADDVVTLPEGVKITSSNTSTIEMKTGEEASGEPEKDLEASSNVDPDVQLEADVQGIKKAEGEIKEELTSKGVDFAALETEFGTSGQLSEESYKALENAGYPRSAVDAYTTGLQAKAEQFVSRVTALAGGEEAFKAVTTFIGSQDDAYIKAFNDALDAGSLKQLDLVIKGAKADMAAKFGTDSPSLLGGDSSASTQGFANQAEMVKAVNDPKYARDKAYTEGVRAKIAATKNIFA